MACPSKPERSRSIVHEWKAPENPGMSISGGFADDIFPDECHVQDEWPKSKKGMKEKI